MKFSIPNIAKIKNAEIEIKPLTIFVGRNGTNKSYMAHLVYELFKELSILSEDKRLLNTLTKSFAVAKNLSMEELESLISNIREEEDWIQYDEDDYHIENYTVNIFSYEKITSFKINLFQESFNFILEYLVKKINKSYNTSIETLNEIYFDCNLNEIFDHNDIEIRAEQKDQAIFIFLRTIVSKIIEEITSLVKEKESFYFPSSRTGFVLAFDEIVSGVFRDRFGGQPTATKLTQPTIDFLSNFAEIKTGKFRDDNSEQSFFSFFAKKNDEEIQIINELIVYLEKEILQGEIVEKTNAEKYTQYLLRTSNHIDLDLHISSSATIELLPIIVFLKHFTKIKDRFFVIEEPEAHLHPHAQIIMARFLVMLVNTGAQVLITTHSDYMIAELNNCIKLSKEKEAFIKKHNLDYGLGNKIYLNDNDVNVYLFKENISQVDVIKLEIDEDGIPFDNFDTVKKELTEKKEFFKFNTSKT